MDNIIQLVFDLDDTLTNNTTSFFIKSLGKDPKYIYELSDKLIEIGYNPTSAYLRVLFDELKPTKTDFIKCGKTIRFFNGVNSLKQRLQEQFPDKKIEFHMITAGVPEIVRSMKIVGMFDSIWTNTIIYDGETPIEIAHSITSSEKIGCLNAIQKKLKNSFISPKNLNKVPHKNIIYIGDGLTDISALTYNRMMGGFSIAVDPKNNWKNEFIKDKRVDGIYSANYGINSDLYKAIIHYITTI